MCAIFGIIGKSDTGLLKKMSKCQLYRGPDDQTFFTNIQLIDHQQSHSTYQYRAFSCNRCHKKFILEDNLESHLQYHFKFNQNNTSDSDKNNNIYLLQNNEEIKSELTLSDCPEVIDYHLQTT